MRTSYTWVTWVAITLLAALATTCGPPVEVHSSATPEAPFALGHYFQMLPAPTRRDGRPSSGEDDHMVTNSIANRTIRQAIVRAFEDRGYLRVDSGATLGVAFYATARAKLDVTVWDYGYPFRPGWPNVSPIERVNPYDEGTVIVDVIRPDSRELFWRGAGKANLSADAARNVTELANTATAIVARFPRAPASVIAGRAR